MPVTVTDVAAPAPLHTDVRAPDVLDDRCPGVVRPHRAADGLLVRVRLSGGRVGPGAWHALDAAAQRASGVVEITSRANVQIRGVAEHDLAPIAEALRAGGLLPSTAHDRVRGVVADPLAGRRRGAHAAAAEVDAVLDALDAALLADPDLADLPARLRIAVEDGSGVADGATPDLRLRAVDAGSWVVDVARRIVAARREAGPARRVWRIADLPGGAEDVVAPGIDLGAPRPDAAGPPPLVGPLPQADGLVAVGAVAPLGALDGLARATLGELAVDRPVRVSDRRTVAVLDVRPSDATAVAAALSVCGLDPDPASGWAGLSACAGQGACPSALVDVRAIARRRAAIRAGARRARTEHWAACPRRCGDGPHVAVAHAALDADGAWDVLRRSGAAR